MATAHVAQDDAFRRGIDARDDKQWPVVAHADARGDRGAARRSRPNRIGARLGVGGTEYLPHYFLGEALFNTGDCAGAVNAWATRNSRASCRRSRPEFVKVIRSGYLECEKKGVLPPGKLDPALARVSQQITEVNKLRRQMSTASPGEPRHLARRIRHARAVRSRQGRDRGRSRPV